MKPKDQIQAAVVALVATAADIDPEPVPLSIAYTALMERGFSFTEFRIVAEAMRSMGIAEVTVETLTLTDKGRVMAARLDAALARAKTTRN